MNGGSEHGEIGFYYIQSEDWCVFLHSIDFLIIIVCVGGRLEEEFTEQIEAGSILPLGWLSGCSLYG